MRNGKRYLSILLTICMLAIILPLNVAAQTPGQGGEPANPTVEPGDPANQSGDPTNQPGDPAN